MWCSAQSDTTPSSFIEFSISHHICDHLLWHILCGLCTLHLPINLLTELLIFPSSSFKTEVYYFSLLRHPQMLFKCHYHTWEQSCAAIKWIIWQRSERKEEQKEKRKSRTLILPSPLCQSSFRSTVGRDSSTSYPQLSSNEIPTQVIFHSLSCSAV